MRTSVQRPKPMPRTGTKIQGNAKIARQRIVARKCAAPRMPRKGTKEFPRFCAFCAFLRQLPRLEVWFRFSRTLHLCGQGFEPETRKAGNSGGKSSHLLRASAAARESDLDSWFPGFLLQTLVASRPG